MSHNSIYIGDTTRFVSTVKDEDGNVVDISGATTLEFHFRKPDGTTMVKTATKVDAGLYGQMEYNALTTDLDQDGRWEHQGYIVLPTGEYHSQVRQFKVKETLI